ncbi:DeoR/GlpR family DNA-binding transcription regulator [Clostridium thailandense]|uniref:DeoR/GlpR family DNA-binding transcription regulator n=1 Tax=Clostridium thailandense TaxID=2794346 RepID=UPI003989128E
MRAKERHNIIKQLLTNNKKVLVSELSDKLDVTEETIRRDLEKLETEGILTRTYGGAVLKEGSFEGVNFYKRATINLEEKQKIAIKAIELLKNKPTIAADSSSTVIEALKLIRNQKDVVLLTNSTEVLREFTQSELTIVSTGGIFNKNSLSLQGSLAKDMIRKYNVDILLISCKGLDKEKGALDSNEVEVEFKKVLVQQASEVALLVDHTKFDRSAFVQLVDFKNIDYVVTDKCPDETWMQFFEENEIKVLY